MIYPPSVRRVLFGAVAALFPSVAVTAQPPVQFKVALCGAANTTSTACQWVDVQTRLMATGFFSTVVS